MRRIIVIADPFTLKNPRNPAQIYVKNPLLEPGERHPARELPPSNPGALCTCADGMLAGYGVVAVFLFLVFVPSLFGRIVERRRCRAVDRALAEP